MEEQFAKRAFIQGPEILHVMGLRLWCSKMGQLNLPGPDVVREGRAYIDDLFSKGELLKGYDENDLRGPMTGAYGLGYYEIETQAFKDLADYYFARCKEAVIAGWPAEADKLLDLMSSDTEGFFAEICWTNDERPNKYAYVPIFSASDAKNFAQRLIDCHPSQQRIVFTAFRERYECNRLSSELAPERDWLMKVREALLSYAYSEDTPPIRRFAIQNDVKRILDPLLGEPPEAQSDLT